MNKLLLALTLGLGAWLMAPESVQAQPNQFFGARRPIPFRWYSYAWDPTYGIYATERVGFVYPGSGYNWGFIRAYSPTYGFTTGYYRGWNNPAFTTGQYFPTYYDPAYFAAKTSYPSPKKSTANADKSYVTPQYYLPTY